MNKTIATTLITGSLALGFGGGTLLTDNAVTPTANVLVKAGSTEDFADGDIVEVFNSKRTLDMLAWQIVKPENMKRTAHGTIEKGELLEKYLEKTMEYKFERISEKEVRRTNLWTGEVDVISDVANKDGEYMDVPLYIARRLNLKPEANRMFGDAGFEYWYGGSEIKTDKVMDEIWDEIELKTNNVRSYDVPFSDAEKKSFIVLKAKDLTDEDVKLLTSPATSTNAKGEEVVLKQRSKQVDTSMLILDTAERTRLASPTDIKDFRNKEAVDIKTILK